MEALYVIVGIVVVALVAGALWMGLRRREAARSRERDELAGEIAQFNASRSSPVPVPVPVPESGAPKSPDPDSTFRKPAMPPRDVDPLNDRSKSLQDRWDGSGRKR